MSNEDMVADTTKGTQQLYKVVEPIDSVGPPSIDNHVLDNLVQTQSIPKRPSDLFPVPLYSRSMAVRIAAAELLAYN